MSGWPWPLTFLLVAAVFYWEISKLSRWLESIAEDIREIRIDIRDPIHPPDPISSRLTSMATDLMKIQGAVDEIRAYQKRD